MNQKRQKAKAKYRRKNIAAKSKTDIFYLLVPRAVAHEIIRE